MILRLLLCFFMWSGLAYADAIDDMEARGIWVHPEMRDAIERTLDGRRADDADGNYVIINGKSYPTGYHPTWSQYDGAKFKNFNGFASGAEVSFPEEFDYRLLGVSPVRGQQCGDCWAQGAVSAFEFIVTAADKASRVFSVQDVIDNSGFGSCGGGQLSMAHFEDGAAYESEYPYKGRTGRPRSDVLRHERALETGYLRGMDGKFPVLADIKQALMATGAMEVCGSASSLGSGGRQDNVRSGSTNHCYALVGWLNGKKQGWLDADYLIIKNSWGDGSGSALANGRDWGDKGYGYYPLAKGDGVNLKGSVITEIQWARYKPLPPPIPVVFSVSSKRTSLQVTLPVGSRYQAANVQAALQKAINSLEQ